MSTSGTRTNSDMITTAMNGHLNQKAATDPMVTLAARIAEARDTDAAMHAVQHAAETEVHTVQWRTVNMLIEDRGFDPVEALRMVIHETTRGIIGRGADDTWSGRGNDLHRVRFDALRRWVQDVGYLLPSGD